MASSSHCLSEAKYDSGIQSLETLSFGLQDERNRGRLGSFNHRELKST